MASPQLISLVVLALCFGHGLTARVVGHRQTQILRNHTNGTQETSQVCCCKQSACTARALKRGDTFEWDTELFYAKSKWGGLGQLAGWYEEPKKHPGKKCCMFMNKCSIWGGTTKYNDQEDGREWLCKGESPGTGSEKNEDEPKEEVEEDEVLEDVTDLPRSLVDLGDKTNDTQRLGQHCCCKQSACSPRALKRGDTFEYSTVARYAKPKYGGFGQIFGKHEEEQEHRGKKCCLFMNKCSIWGGTTKYNDNEDDRTWLCRGEAPPTAPLPEEHVPPQEEVPPLEEVPRS